MILVKAAADAYRITLTFVPRNAPQPCASTNMVAGLVDFPGALLFPRLPAANQVLIRQEFISCRQALLPCGRSSRTMWTSQ